MIRVSESLITLGGKKYTYGEIFEGYNITNTTCVGYNDLPSELKDSYDIYTLKARNTYEDTYYTTRSVNTRSLFVEYISSTEELTQIFYFEYNEDANEVNCIGTFRNDYGDDYQNSNLRFLILCQLWEKYLR